MTEVFGFDVDFRRLRWYHWLLVVSLVWAPPVAIGLALGFATRRAPRGGGGEDGDGRWEWSS